MKRFILTLSFLLLTPFIASAAAYAPAVGGTGTTTPPNYGQILVGNAQHTYTLTSTSSLGISSSASSFSTTSTDYWKTQRNFYSTTSADYWLSTKSTSDLIEGTNQFWQNGRFDARLAGTTTLPNITTLANLGTVKTSLSGILKASSGVLSVASAGTDFENPLTFLYPLTRSTNSISLAFATTTTNTWVHQIFTSLFATNASSTNATTTGSVYFTGLSGSGGELAIDGNGRVYKAASTTAGTGLSYSGTSFNVSGLTTSQFASANVSQWTNDANYITLGSLSATAPIFYSSGNFKWYGLSTTTQPASSNLLTSNGTNGVYGTATTSISAGTGISLSGSFPAGVGGSAGTITNSGVISASCSGGTTCSGTNPLSISSFSYPFPLNATTSLLSLFGGASTTQLSVFQKLYVGGAATTTIDGNGNIVVPSGSNLTLTGKADGCGTFSSGVLGTTGTPCGSGSGGITAIGNFASTSGTLISFSTTTASFNGLTAGLTIVPSANALLFAPTFSGTLNNTGLTNSSLTINTGANMSGGGSVSLGGSLTLTSTSPVATSSQETAGQLAVFGTTNGQPAKLYSQSTSTLTASSPLTGSFTQIGSGGALGIQAASASQNGYLSSGDYSLLHVATTTFSTPLVYTLGTNAVTCPTCNTSNASVSSIATTWPITGGPITTTGTLAFNGLSTSSNAVVSNIPYFSGVNTFANVATSSFATNGSLSYTGTLGALVGGGGGSLSLNMANPNTWSALQTFSNASTTAISATTASSTFYSGAGLDAGCSGSSFLQITLGKFGCATPVGGGGTGVGTIATSSLEAYRQIPWYDAGSAYPARLNGGDPAFTFSTSSPGALLNIGKPSGTFDIGKIVLSYAGSVTDNTVTLAPAGGTSGAKTITVPAGANGTMAVSASGNIAEDSAGNITFTGTLPILSGGTNQTVLSKSLLWFDGTSISATSSIVTVGSIIATTTLASQFPYASSTAITTGNFFFTSATGTNIFANHTGNTASFGATATTTITSAGQVGYATSTPWAIWSIHAAGGSIWPFAIGSSTNTLFGVNQAGAIHTTASQPATTTAITLDWPNTPPQIEYRIGAANVTITINNATTSFQWGSRKLVWVCNPGSTAGTLTWVGVEWIGSAPTQTTAASQCDAYSFDITAGTSTTAYKVAGTQGAAFQ